PVVSCCGGCPMHWSVRSQTVYYHAPPTPRLADFAPRSVAAIDHTLLPRAARNLLVIPVSRDERFTETCAHLLAALAPTLDCHTIAWDAEFGELHGKSVTKAIPRNQRLRMFFDTLHPAS